MYEIEKSIADLEQYVKVDTALNSTTVSAFWIKDKSFRFLRYNQAMINLLYPTAEFDDLYYKTDWEYAESIGCSTEVVDSIKNCCTLSDEYVLNGTTLSEKFFEKCQVVGGGTIWLFTTKSRIPPASNVDNCLGLYGTATIFNQAEKLINTKALDFEQLSDSCFRVVD